MPVSTEDREWLSSKFWYRVDKEGGFIHPVHGRCWEWIGGRSRGRGMLGWHGTMIMASRVSWILHHGYNPDCCVLHKCDNPSCVNPDHLFLGSQADNMKDKISKGRSSNVKGVVPQYYDSQYISPFHKGEKHYSAKLTGDQVIDLIARSGAGEPQKSLAKKFGISQPHVSNILSGRKRKHL